MSQFTNLMPLSPLGELAAKQTEGGGVRTGNWELQWKTDRNDRFFESMCPLTPLGSSPEGELLLADILICPESVLAISLMGARYDR